MPNINSTMVRVRVHRDIKPGVLALLKLDFFTREKNTAFVLMNLLLSYNVVTERSRIKCFSYR